MPKSKRSDKGVWWDTIIPHLERIEPETIKDVLKEADQVYRFTAAEILEELQTMGTPVTLKSTRQALSTLVEGYREHLPDPDTP